MGFKKFFYDYLEYYPSEKRGVFYLTLIIVFWVLGLVVYYHWPVPVGEDKAFEAAVRDYYASLDRTDRSGLQSKSQQIERNWNLFAFDPNTISYDSLRLMGLPESPSRALVNYRESGGSYKSPGDLAKLYTLSESDFQRIRPYVRILEDENKVLTQGSHSAFDKDTIESVESNQSKQNWRLNRKIIVELNTADTTALMSIHGIGPYFANRIVQYREELGGYRSMEQLLEIYRFDSVMLDRLAPHFVLDTGAVQRINLNHVSLDSLRKHPYFPYNLANSLVKIRQVHGPYRHIEDIRRSHLVNDSIFMRIKPYLEIHD